NLPRPCTSHRSCAVFCRSDASRDLRARNPRSRRPAARSRLASLLRGPPPRSVGCSSRAGCCTIAPFPFCNTASASMLPPIEYRIADELGVSPRQVIAAVQLLDDGATVPFIARYRKEVTGGLDDTHLRTLEERLGYLRELEDRRATVIASIDEQGKLSAELRAELEHADTKQRLEDLYLPYKPKRRTKAQIAREAGIGPLAEALLADPNLTPEIEAEKYLNAEAGFADTKAVLDGARQILMEHFAEDATLLGELRAYLHDHGQVRSAVIEGKENEGAKFRDWFDFAEPIATMPS